MPERESQDRTPLEEEGIPDLQDGTPEQQWASDPQEAPPVNAEEPVAADEHGVTADEQLRGESLDTRLARERPERGLQDVDTTGPTDIDAQEEAAAGRLVEQDEGARTDTEKETTAGDAGVDGGGFAPEERAVYTEPEEEI